MADGAVREAVRYTLCTSSIPAARESNEAISSRDGALPFYVHKWTKAKRRYRPEDLLIPERLHFFGTNPDWSRPLVSVGGTRSPIAETFSLVSNVCRRLAEMGATIVSGGVPGVDLSAHIAATDVEGASSVAVLANPAGSGLHGHEWYSESVQKNLISTGGFISEYVDSVPIGGAVFRERLLQRDRITSGISDVFVVFECNYDSATIDTARRAVLQGKSTFAVRTGVDGTRHGINQIARSRVFSNTVIYTQGLDTLDEICKSIYSAALYRASSRLVGY